MKNSGPARTHPSDSSSQLIPSPWTRPTSNIFPLTPNRNPEQPKPKSNVPSKPTSKPAPTTSQKIDFTQKPEKRPPRSTKNITSLSKSNTDQTPTPDFTALEADSKKHTNTYKNQIELLRSIIYKLDSQLEHSSSYHLENTTLRLS
jgi:hypothetical protein